MTSYLEETIKRIQSHPGVIGVVVLTSDGALIKTTLDQKTATEYSLKISDIIDTVRSMVKEMEPSNDLTFLRMRTKKNEIMIVPDKDYILVTIKNPHE